MNYKVESVTPYDSDKPKKEQVTELLAFYWKLLLMLF